MRAFMLTVTGLVLSVAACSSYGTSVVDVDKNPPKVASVSISIPRAIIAGQTARATAVPKDANGTPLPDRAIAWSTLSPAIASVDNSGMISGIAPGTAVLSAMSEGVSGQASVAVTPPPPVPVATVSVALNPSAVLIGQTAAATATLSDANGAALSGRTITWQSSNTSVATVDASGAVAGVAAGSALISASSEGKTGSAPLTVSAPAPIPVASVSVSPSAQSLLIGATVQLSATMKDANNNALTGRAVSWSSSNSSIATVSSAGLVTAVAAGSATVTASSEGKTGASTITVTAPAPVPVATVSVSPASPSMQTGATVQLSAVTRDANNNVLTGRAVAWTSNNTSIATVSSSGLVSAVAAGSATITASSEGKSGTSSVTVTSPAPVPVATVSVSPSAPSIQAGSTVQLSAVTRDANNNVLSGRVVTWTSSNSGVADVSSSGLVTGVAAGGPVTITATSETKTGTSSVTVTAVVPPPGGSVEPSGMTTMTERPFSARDEDGWGIVAASGSVNNFSIVSDAAAPQSPSTIGQVLYPAGFSGGGEPVNLYKTFNTQYRTLYISVWIKVSANWDGHPTLVNKVIHLNTGGNTGGANHVVPTIWGSGSDMLQAGVLLQGIVTDGTGKTAVNLYPNLGHTGEIVRGRWHHWEMIFVGNTSGATNASADWWIDGVKVGSYSGMQYVPGNSYWDQLAWAPTWGGGGSTVQANMTMSFDHIRVSGK